MLTKRYSIKLKLNDVEYELPVALFGLSSLNLPVVPELILGRES